MVNKSQAFSKIINPKNGEADVFFTYCLTLQTLPTNTFTDVPAFRKVPLIVTLVPPDTGPRVGEILDSTGS